MCSTSLCETAVAYGIVLSGPACKKNWARCGSLKCWKLKNYFFYSLSLFSFSCSFSFSLFSHTTGQKSANLIGETDSTAQFTLWSPWTATSQTPWIRSYTPPWPPSVHITNPPLSFTQPIQQVHTTTYPYSHSIPSVTWLLQIPCGVMQCYAGACSLI